MTEPAVDHAQYQVIAARRLQWDNLVWQVPVLSMTAQAFLFAIALSHGDRLNRVIAAGLSLVLTFLSITLMGRHRQAELTDADWLDRYEQVHFPSSLHGESFQVARQGQHVGTGLVERLVPLPRGFRTWVIGLSLFGVAALVALVRAVFNW